MTENQALTRGDLELARTYLFVPGTRPDRFDKAVASGADVVILDLEDAVAPQQKAEARRNVAAWLGAGGRAVVRVNALDTQWFESDLAEISAAAAIILPKVETVCDVETVDSVGRGGVWLIPLLETPNGLLNVERICSLEQVVRVAFGNIDFAARVGVDPSSRVALSYARSRIVYASSAAGCAAPIDGVTTAIDDMDRLRSDTLHSRELGFRAKLLIHPSQVAPVAEALGPTLEELRWARSVLEKASGGARALEHEMVDEPVRLRARRLLDEADYGIDLGGRLGESARTSRREQ